MKRSFRAVAVLVSFLLLALSAAPAGRLWSSEKQQSLPASPSLDPLAQADETLKKLTEGNQRFAAGQLAQKEYTARRMELIKGQTPSAVILSCSDSRVPPEIVFDQGLGELFVVRVAGNVADPVELGSIEYAVEHLGVPLIIVLGHDRCGAVSATIKGGKQEGNIRAVVRRIAPAVRKAKAAGKKGDELLDAAVIENAHAVAAGLTRESKIIKHLVDQRKLKIVAAKYAFDSGRVEVLEPPRRGIAAVR